jgi:putative PIN family toxin of toxin-antitoxin system
MKVVVDVNVWISGLLWGGVPGKILKLAKNQRITIVASQKILADIEDTLERPKLQSRKQYCGYTTAYLMTIVQELIQPCVDRLLEVPQLRDPDDAVILASAIVIQAEVIITGDLDLLTLHNFENIPIITPQEFLSRYFNE